MQKKHTMEVLLHEQVGKDVYRMTLAGTVGAKPGQFVQVEVSPTHDPFLRRPLSVHNCTENTLTLLYRAAGRGTGLLSQKKAGEPVSVIGPLGSGFSESSQDRIIVVAGGIGAAPLYFLLHSLQAADRHITFFYGAKTADELVLQEEYRTLSHEFALATDDGSAGKCGLVTELLKEALCSRPAEIYACGPEAMLRSAAKLAAEYNSACFVSLESRMACGVGACLGCVILAADGNYRRVCVDGPVFAAEEVFGSDS